MDGEEGIVSPSSSCYLCWASPLLPVQIMVDIQDSELWEEGVILGTFLVLEHRACLLACLHPNPIIEKAVCLCQSSSPFFYPLVT